MSDAMATLLAAHRLYGEDGDDVFECGCGAKSSPEALEEDFGEQLWHERHLADLLTARVAEALSEVADVWQTKDWADVLLPAVKSPIVNGQRVTDWLRSRATQTADQQ